MARALIGNFKGPQGPQGLKGDIGPQGPAGATGATGATGPKGSTGTRGSRWTSGTAITGTSTTGTVFSETGITDALANDFYLNVETGNVYRCTVAGTYTAAKWAYAGNIKGVQGDAGPKGDKGNTGATGATGSTGTRGSRWTSGTAITGTSTTGTVFSGSGITTSLVNDFYLNVETGNVYRCTVTGSAAAAKWAYAGNIKGVKGDAGPTGPQGPTGEKGATGETGPTGPKGDTGPKGNTGTRGSRWSSGTAITGTSTTATVFSGTGITDALVNDMYLNTSTGNTYRCTVAGAASAAKWVYVGNIKGVKGDTGATGPAGATGATGATGAEGPQGPQGVKGNTGTRGSRWVNGIKVTGTSTTPTVFSESGISDSLVNDFYLNTTTSNVYRCTTSGNASTAKWVYVGNIKGDTGDITSVLNLIGTLSALKTNAKNDLVSAINEVFQLGNENKGKLVTNLVAMGVSASTSETWASLIGKVLTIFTGIDVSDTTAGASDVIETKYFHTSDGALTKGTMPVLGEVTTHIKCGANEYGLYPQIPAGAYMTPSWTGYPEIFVPREDVVNAYNITPEKIMTGQSLLGVNGNAVSDTTAGAWDVLETKQFHTSDGALTTGAIPVRGKVTSANNVLANDANLFFYIPKGAYMDGVGDYPEIIASLPTVASALGITGDKILAGNTICGVAGTAMSRKYASGTLPSLAGGQYTTKECVIEESCYTRYFRYVDISIGFVPKVIVFKVKVDSRDTYALGLVADTSLANFGSSSLTQNHNTMMIINQTYFVRVDTTLASTTRLWYMDNQTVSGSVDLTWYAYE